MTIAVTSQAKNYAPGAVRGRYVRFDPHRGVYRFCEVGDDRRFDLRQGDVTADEIPEPIRAAAHERVGRFPSYVEWPR